MAEAVGFEPTCPCGQLHFECSSLQPLRYASMHKYSLFRTNHMISSRSRYDRFDSPPYISTVFRALRKCKKNTQEQYEILKFDPAKTLINQGFSAEKTARANAHFESVPLWPLRYRSVSISACHSRRFQSTQKSFGEKSRRENIKVFDLEFWKPRISKGFRGDEIPRSRRNFEPFRVMIRWKLMRSARDP